MVMGGKNKAVVMGGAEFGGLNLNPRLAYEHIA